MKETDRHTILKKLLSQDAHLFLPHVSVDTVIFGYSQRQLKILLLQVLDDTWMLPGGYVLKEESIDQAARRNLKDRIGLSQMYLSQFHAFGNTERDFSQEISELFTHLGTTIDRDSWILKRFVSIGYYALVDIQKCNPSAGLFARNYMWCNVRELPKLIFDHQDIVSMALESLQRDTQDFPIPFHLLDKEFTMPELHAVFETIHDKKLDRSRFQKKMFGYGVFERLHVLNKTVPYRKPYVYHFKKQILNG